jgi:hypothetical protein
MLESKNATFPIAGIQNYIISACWNPKLNHFCLLESTCIVSASWNPKLHHFHLLESKTASFLLAGIQNCIGPAGIRLLESKNVSFPHAGIHNGIISACWKPKLHHFCVLKSKSASFPPDGIHMHCLCQLESKTASFPPTGIQNGIISAC